jgi:hypothetical protein
MSNNDRIRIHNPFVLVSNYSLPVTINLGYSWEALIFFTLIMERGVSHMIQLVVVVVASR